jgi:hypothetical protein
MRPLRTKKAEPREIRHDTSLPPIAQAANLALLILARTHRSTWAKLAANPDTYSEVAVSADQQALLDEHLDVIALLATAPARTLYACPACSRWALIEPKAVPPARCNLLLGCEGRPVKASTVAPRFAKQTPAASPSPLAA